jgi:ribosomal protein L16 Arg81 hydroxylase
MIEAAAREYSDGAHDAAPPRWSEDALAFLIAPIAREAFLRDHYEREALISIREEPALYADLLTLESLDAFIAGADLREGMLDLTDHHNRLTRDSYVDDRGRIMASAVTELYMKGATIILPHLHDSMANLGELCRSLEEIFSCHVQTNVYLTPRAEEDGRANQGFPPHYDNHDVFVMQVSGAKAWRLYDVPVEIPYRGEPFDLSAHKAGAISREFTLRPGDCAYIPRGLMHDAENVGAEPSLHVTVGLITKTWADLLLESISELALTEPAFRRSLPAGFAARDFDRTAARAHFDGLIARISEKAGMDGAFDLLADNFMRARRPNTAGVIAAAQRPIAATTRFCRRRFVPWNVAGDDGKIVLIGPGDDIDFNAADGDALERALSGAPFGLGDLACEDPADFVRTLWSAGYLERIAD